MSEQNSEFSELFYEIRHKTYDTAWEQYKKQLEGDIIEQVFMSVTASLLSAAVEAFITGITAGTGILAAKAAGTLTYLSVYTLMTKFYIDIDLAKAEAKDRSQTFTPVSSDNREPTSLNEKNLLDRVLGDSMAAALIGHPGGYYTEVSGGEPGNKYTGQLLVSPPNLLRAFYSFDGFLDLLWENFWSMGGSDPDAYAALDFDGINLDYFLLTSELPSYNQDPYYTYENADGIFDLYNMYALNTLGYLETQVSQASGGQYDAIRATCIDGRPQYEFINSTTYQTVTPQSVLYRPIVLSQERYDQLQLAPGNLVVKAQCKDYSNTIGINAYNMSDLERKLYAAKVPLNDNGFEYPIRQISIDVVKYNIYTGLSYFVKGLVVNESDYSIDLGNLYFTKSIEELVSEKCNKFEKFLEDALADELIESKIYFNVRVVFDVFIPDTTEESSSLALAQATSYAIMDYFNQYVFAETSANMIGEITYTETMTYWSTLISAPLVYFGSWAVTAGVGKAFTGAGATAVKASIERSVVTGLKGMILSPIQEVFQEIIEDGFIEAVVENFANNIGWTEDAGFWLSSFATSVRETTGALGQLARGDASIKTTISIIKARMSGDTETFVEISKKIEQNLKQKQDAETIKQSQMSFWEKMIKTGFLKGLYMVMPSILFGSFSFVALAGVKKMMASTIKLSPLAYGMARTKIQANRRGELSQLVGEQDAFGDNLQEKLKKPAELEVAKPEINEKYREQSGENKPLAAILSGINHNPKNSKISNILNKFKNLISSTSSDKSEAKKTEDPFVVEDVDKIVEESAQSRNPEVKLDKTKIGDDYEGLLPHYDRNIINYLYSLSFNSENLPERPNKAYSKLIFNSELLAEAREFLKSTSYNNLDIIANEIINPEVLQELGDKFNLGIEFSKLERIIADVFVLSGDGSNDLGPSINNENSYGKVNSESLSNENSLEKTKVNQEKVGVMQQKGKSMPELEPGGRVGYIKHKSGKEYEIGDIIIYNMKGVIIFHEVVGYKDISSGRVYTTKGINNKNPDRKGVYEHQVIGQVVKFSKQDLTYLTEMAEHGRISYIEGFGMTKFNEVIQKVVSVFKGLKSKLSQALFGRNDELDSLMASTELNYEDISNFIDKIAELKPDDVGKPLNFLRNLKRQSINEYYEILNDYASKELKVIIKPGVTNVYKALDLIMNAHVLFNFKGYDGYKGIVIENVKVDPDNIAHTQFKAKSYPSGRIIINENFYLNRDLMDMVLNNFIPHELGHIKIRQEYDIISKALGIECLKWSIVDNQIAEEIEEFSVNANIFSYLEGEQKMMYAEQYCKWLGLLLSEKWSGFTDVNGEQKSAKDLTSREMLIIMHHKVILEYIQQNVLGNNRDLNVIKRKVDKYYQDITEYLGGLNFGLNMKKHIEKYILDKLRSYINEKSRNKMERKFFKEYLTIFPKNTDIDHTGETWIGYISNVLFPSFENEYLR